MVKSYAKKTLARNWTRTHFLWVKVLEILWTQYYLCVNFVHTYKYVFLLIRHHSYPRCKSSHSLRCTSPTTKGHKSRVLTCSPLSKHLNFMTFVSVPAFCTVYAKVECLIFLRNENLSGSFLTVPSDLLLPMCVLQTPVYPSVSESPHRLPPAAPGWCSTFPVARHSPCLPVPHTH